MFFYYILAFFIIIIFFLVLGLASNFSEKYTNLNKLKKIRENNNKQEYIDFSIELLSKSTLDIAKIRDSISFIDKNIKDELFKLSNDDKSKLQIQNIISEINKFNIVNQSDGWNSVAIQDLVDNLIIQLKKL